MATYRFEAKIIGRSQGSSATASAAYRSAEKLPDERTGAVFDYTRKRGVLYAEILAPEGTPDWMTDRAQLWNAVEKVEKRKDSQLARDVLLSLPHELTHGQRLDLVQEFVANEFVAKGMIADVAIHAPDRRGDDRNHHAHVMLTMRELAGAGFGPKVREWNSTEQLEQWREDWAMTVNRHLERHGHEARVDHRSLADQGIDREPEPKQGPIATEIERQGRPSHAGDDRRAVQERNAERATVAAELAIVTADIIDLEKARAAKTGQGTMIETNSAETYAQRLVDKYGAQSLNQQQATDAPETSPPPQEQSPDVEIEAREHARLQVQQTEEMSQQRERLDAFEAQQRRVAEEAQKEEAEQKRRANAAEDLEIRDAGNRYRIALGEHYDGTDPYGSLARAAMAEYAAFIRDRETLDQEIVKERDPEARKALELRKEIEACDYMSITSRRIAGQSVVITGREDSEEAVKFRERAAEYEARSQELREEYRDIKAGRTEWVDKDEDRIEVTNDRDLNAGEERGAPARVEEPSQTAGHQSEDQAPTQETGGLEPDQEPEPDQTVADEPAQSEPTTERRFDSEHIAETREAAPSAREETPATDGNVEMTDKKAEQLAALGERRAEIEGSLSQSAQQPVRSPGGPGR